MTTGIIFGLAAALMQSVSYLFSAAFIAKHQTSSLRHLILVHITIGLISLAALPLLWHPAANQLFDYAPALFAAAATYMFGQFSLYQAIRLSAASRVSPLLGVKILILAFIGSLFLSEEYSFLQWGAVGLCVCGAAWLSASGGKINVRALGWVIAACLGYAGSDLSIVVLMKHFSELPLIDAAMISVSLSFLLCGIASMFFWPQAKSFSLLKASAPAAISWILAMVFLFACFAEIGVVFGGIVQSSRGLISIFLAIIVGYAGLHFADPVPEKRVLLQRIGAAAIMVISIALFSLGKLSEI